MKTLFISDLHLDPERADIQACFEQFIKHCLSANQTADNTIDSLYILGDLFEVWLGDDASIPVYKQAVAQLKQLAESGTRIYVMHGNRDFLLGSDFAQASGCQLIPDLHPVKFISNNNDQQSCQTILLSHGDVFCTADKEYMNFRKMVRDPLWQQQFLAKPIAERVSIAAQMRTQSKQKGQEKASDITDVEQGAIEQAMLKYNCNTIIHGHTHRPAVHEFKLRDRNAKRIVLPDWTPDAEAFEIHTSG